MMTTVDDVGEGAVTAHNTHPVVESIKLKPIEDDPATTDVNEKRTLGNHVTVKADD